MTGKTEVSTSTPPAPHHPGYAPNAAFHAIKRHALEFVNPKELMVSSLERRDSVLRSRTRSSEFSSYSARLQLNSPKADFLPLREINNIVT